MQTCHVKVICPRLNKRKARFCYVLPERSLEKLSCIYFRLYLSKSSSLFISMLSKLVSEGLQQHLNFKEQTVELKQCQKQALEKFSILQNQLYQNPRESISFQTHILAVTKTMSVGGSQLLKFRNIPRIGFSIHLEVSKSGFIKYLRHSSNNF